MTQATEALEKIDLTALAQFINPEDLAAMNDKFAGGISGGTFLPEIKYRGNRWRLKVEGVEQVLPGDFIHVHLIEARPNVSKTFYVGGYEQGSDAKPDCSSIDGFVPDSHIQNPQADNCQTCQNNAWGSKISESGGKGKACSDYKQIVVAFRGHLDKAFALRVPAASLKGYKSYITQLGYNKVPAPLAITQITLDPETTYPSLLFSCVGVQADKTTWDAAKALAETTDVRQVVQIQPRADRALEAPKTAEQPVVVEAPAAEPEKTAAPDLRSILEGTTAKKTRSKKKSVEEVIEESTSTSEEPAAVEPGVVNSLDELLSKL